MKRVHLFEFEDQRWYPGLLRDLATGFLQYSADNNKSDLYTLIIPVISKGLTESGHHQIVDLASGAGGPYKQLAGALQQDHPGLKILLTDYFPNLDAYRHIQHTADNISYITYPVDARKVPPALTGFRTYFLSFHHFQPKDAISILQDAVNNRSGIAIFEDQERSLRSALREASGSLSLLRHSLFIKPLKITRLLFTYIIPVLPFTFLWDGLVSCLRTYSEKEMHQLISKVENKDHFNWETGRLQTDGGMILYLLGTPKKA